MTTFLGFIVMLVAFFIALGFFGMAIMWAMIDWHYSIYYGVAGTLIVAVGYFIFGRLKG